MSQPRGATAFLALWNGMADPARQDEYELWHSFEHVPERVSLPGFLSARRYRSVGEATAPIYFTLYWLESLAAMNEPAYQQVFAQPTRWTASMRTQLTGFLRLPCALESAHGVSGSSRLLTLRLQASQANVPEVVDELLRERVRDAAFLSAHSGVYTETAAIPIANRDPAATAPQAGRDRVVLLHGLDFEPLRAQARELVHLLSPLATLAGAPQSFELLTEVRRENLPASGKRPPPRDDLFQAFQRGDTK